MTTAEDIIKKLFEHKVYAQVVRNNHRFKQLDFSHKTLVKDQQETPGFHQRSAIAFTGKITFDALEGKVTSWDYDEDGDQATAQKLHLDSIIGKILN